MDPSQAAPAGNQGTMAPATPSNFSQRVAQNSAMPPPAAIQPQPRQAWDQFQKPPVDGSQFQQPGVQGQGTEQPGEQAFDQAEGGQQAQGEAEQGQLPGMTPEQQQALMAKITESFSTGVMPEELMDVWTIKVPWGEAGNFRDVPARELQKSFMRQSDYTAKTTQLRQFHEQTQRQQQGLNAIFSRMDTHEGLAQVMMQLGKPEVLEAAGKEALKKWWEEEKIARSLPADQQQAYRQRMQRAKEAERTAAMEIRRREDAERAANNNQGQQQQQQRAEYIQRQIDQMRPMAFKALGVIDTPYHRQVFENQLVAVVNALPHRWNGEVTREMAWSATQGAKEVIEDDQRRAMAANTQQQQPGNQPLNPLRLPAGPNSQTPQQRQNGQRRRPGSFGDDMRTRNGGRPSF